MITFLIFSTLLACTLGDYPVQYPNFIQPYTVYAPPEAPRQPAIVYGPPTVPYRPSIVYGPPIIPKKPVFIYGPPSPPPKPTIVYGPPAPPPKPTIVYGPPAPPPKPTIVYGPPAPPPQPTIVYGPPVPPQIPQKPVPVYGVPNIHNHGHAVVDIPKEFVRKPAIVQPQAPKPQFGISQHQTPQRLPVPAAVYGVPNF